jgi:hypothetical protein
MGPYDQAVYESALAAARRGLTRASAAADALKLYGEQHDLEAMRFVVDLMLNDALKGHAKLPITGQLEIKDLTGTPRS